MKECIGATPTISNLVLGVYDVALTIEDNPNHLKNETNIMIDILYPAALNQVDISAMKVSFQEYITPTKLELSVQYKIADIIYPGSLAAGDAMCYQSLRLTPGKTV
jgi:hypothetical protein